MSDLLVSSANNLLHIVDETDSTNEELKRRLGERMLPHGYGLMAKAQTSGKGRCGRVWTSFADDLAASFLLRVPVKLALPLPLVVGIAVTDMLLGAGLSFCGLKWPNDVLVPAPANNGEQEIRTARDKEREPLPLTHKICGILCENAGTVDDECLVVAGIGVNLNSEPNKAVTDRPVVSFKQLTGSCLEPEKAFVSLADCLISRVGQLKSIGFAAPENSLKHLWYSRCVYKGGFIEARTPQGIVRGQVRGLGNEGQLLVLSEGAVREIWAGDVEKTRQSLQPL
ncbi:MAG: biotin--[acetyl-CoA-carboxylase] ligase [bacterium]|nr:biotin--[acetyl-CoA-carboxylase] ligase [bacterium]